MDWMIAHVTKLVAAKKTTTTLKQTLTVLTILLITTISFGQKFMLKNNDTLPLKEEMVIRDGDTSYLSTCWTLEIKEGRIINQRDQNCLPQGNWIITDSLGNYKTGNYKDGKAYGLWKQFDKSGKLLNERESVSIGRDTYITKEIDYSSGQAATIVDKPFLAFYLKNLIAIFIILFLSFFSRIFINSKIYNVENGTDYSPIYFFAPGYLSNNFGHSLLCTFSFWFSKYKPENRQLVLISNALSFIAIGLFLGIIIGLAITREI